MKLWDPGEALSQVPRSALGSLPPGDRASQRVETSYRRLIRINEKIADRSQIRKKLQMSCATGFRGICGRSGLREIRGVWAFGA